MYETWLWYCLFTWIRNRLRWCSHSRREQQLNRRFCLFTVSHIHHTVPMMHSWKWREKERERKQWRITLIRFVVRFSTQRCEYASVVFEDEMMGLVRQCHSSYSSAVQCIAAALCNTHTHTHSHGHIIRIVLSVLSTTMTTTTTMYSEKSSNYFIIIIFSCLNT